MPGDDARSLRAPFDAERLQGKADALIDGMRRDLELGRDFLRRKMLVDEQQAIELTLRELCNSPSQFFVHSREDRGTPPPAFTNIISEQTRPTYTQG